MAEKKNPQAEPVMAGPEGKLLDIRFSFPDDQRVTFSNYALVQNEGQEVYLSFFEVRPPVLLGTPEERWEQLKSLDGVEAKCVSRVVLSTGRIPGLIQALTEQYNKAQERAQIEKSVAESHNKGEKEQ